jgi:mannan endo-1,6-alpha-mannosidase
MSAVEYDFPEPDQAPASYLEVAKNCFESITPRWDEGSCNGGFKWQIYPERIDGYNYKNSISNGAIFALAARLARYTGEQKYADWAVKVFDWTKAVGLISDNYEVFDGTDDLKNCTDRDHTQWSYNIGMYLHGAAVMYNYTNGQDVWKKHTEGFLKHSARFFKPYDNATDIMFEKECETGDPYVSGRAECNVDQQSFKAYLSRFLTKTAIMAPFAKDQVTKWLRTSAKGAAASCSGGADGATCGSKWYVGHWDGMTGVGQQLAALEVTQSLLYLKNAIAPRVGGQQDKPSPKPSSKPATSSIPASSKSPKPSEAPSETPAPSPSKTPTPPSEGTTKAPESSNAAPVSSAASAPHAENKPSGKPVPANEGEDSAPTEGCNCAKSTVTVWVPPTTAVPTPPPPAPPATNSTPTHPSHYVPPPPANTTAPLEFTGAAANTKTQLTGMALFVAIASVVSIGAL